MGGDGMMKSVMGRGLAGRRDVGRRVAPRGKDER